MCKDPHINYNINRYCRHLKNGGKMWQDHPGIDSQHHYPKCNVDVYVTFNLRLNAEGNLRVRFPKLSDSDTQIAESVLSQDGTLLDQRTPRIEKNAAGFPSNTSYQNIRELMKIPVLFCVLCAGGFTRTTFTGASCRLRLT